MKKLLFVLIFLLSFIFLSPKEFLYKHGVDILQKQGISVKEEKIEESFTSLHVKRLDAQVIKAETLEANLFGVYNILSFRNPQSTFVSMSVKEAKLIQHIFDPLNVNIWISLNNGEIVGKYKINENSLKLVFNPKDKQIPSFIKNTFINNKGEYTYEFTF